MLCMPTGDREVLELIVNSGFVSSTGVDGYPKRKRRSPLSTTPSSSAGMNR
jgi:hypothetical protein